jgi:hypothetical protein
MNRAWRRCSGLVLEKKKQKKSTIFGHRKCTAKALGKVWACSNFHGEQYIECTAVFPVRHCYVKVQPGGRHVCFIVYASKSQTRGLMCEHWTGSYKSTSRAQVSLHYFDIISFSAYQNASARVTCLYQLLEASVSEPKCRTTFLCEVPGPESGFDDKAWRRGSKDRLHILFENLGL